MIDYNIIATGSKGNAVVINKSILIDCGVPFKALREAYKDLKLVLLTHMHFDHFNKSTIKRLAQERPTLRFATPEWLVEDLVNCGVDKRNIDVAKMGKPLIYGRFPIVEAESLPHNVPNCAWHIMIGAERVFYATDCNSLDHITANHYDLYLVEANHTEADITERIRQKQEAGEHCYEWDVLQNHLSKEKTDAWLYENMGVNSKYVYLHQHEPKEAQ